MIGKLVNGKIVYSPPIYNFLSGGNWQDGFSKVSSTGGGEMKYDYSETDVEMVEGCRYRFELEDNIAKIIKRAK